ncbi:hypothetical protein F4805DRAFT_458158 [Annulohypoxylon moriforme]|nr:hypothetical protein F4805DRAFT_458158 [Annulohypoxylon moriforme]
MSSPTSSQNGKTNSLITLMCEEAGIEAPGEDAYTGAPSSPLTREQKAWVRTLIRERENGASATQASDHASASDDDHSADHQDTQTVDNALVCETCLKIFKNKGTLRQHLKLTYWQNEVHVGLKCYWPCDCDFQCEEEVTMKQHLREHNIRAGAGVPNGEKTCNFPGCGKKCTSAEEVGRHFRRHAIEAKRKAEAEQQDNRNPSI